MSVLLFESGTKEEGEKCVRASCLNKLNSEPPGRPLARSKTRNPPRPPARPGSGQAKRRRYSRSAVDASRGNCPGIPLQGGGGHGKAPETPRTFPKARKRPHLAARDEDAAGRRAARCPSRASERAPRAGRSGAAARESGRGGGRRAAGAGGGQARTKFTGRGGDERTPFQVLKPAVFLSCSACARRPPVSSFPVCTDPRRIQTRAPLFLDRGVLWGPPF